MDSPQSPSLSLVVSIFPASQFQHGGGRKESGGGPEGRGEEGGRMRKLALQPWWGRWKSCGREDTQHTTALWRAPDSVHALGAGDAKWGRVPSGGRVRKLVRNSQTEREHILASESLCPYVIVAFREGPIYSNT